MIGLPAVQVAPSLSPGSFPNFDDYLKDLVAAQLSSGCLKIQADDVDLPPLSARSVMGCQND
jgi:hypothetical protein